MRNAPRFVRCACKCGRRTSTAPEYYVYVCIRMHRVHYNTYNVSVSHFLNDEEVHKASLPQSYDLERPHLACAMLIRSLVLLAALASSAIADVEFVTPAAGSTVVGAKTLSVTWKESGVKPPITSFTTFTIFLVAGGDEVESQVCIQPMKRECEQARPLLRLLIRKRDTGPNRPWWSGYVQRWEHSLWSNRYHIWRRGN